MLAAADLPALSPLLLLLAATVLVMLLAAFRPGHRLAAAATAASLLLALASLWPAARAAPRQVTGLLLVDGFGLFYIGLVVAAALATCLIAYAYFAHRGGRREAFYILLLAATLGAATLAVSEHFAAFFLGLELLSVSLFALVAYPAGERRPLEAGIKYLVLAGASSALLLFGLALIYYEAGSLKFAGLGVCIASPAGDPGDHQGWLVVAGNALLLAGIGFKLSLVPFHLWAPDVYEGAPAPAAGFLATVSKGAVAAALLRYAGEAGLYAQDGLLFVLQLAALLSIVAGNLLALLQDNLKRLLAYSSIAHVGYLLVAVIAGGPFGAEAASYYLLAYFAMSLGAFGVVAALSSKHAAADTDRLEQYRGLFWTRPCLAGILTVNLLSLAGIPLTIGFIAKFYLFAIGIEAARWYLVAALVLGSVLGLFYYLRVVLVLFASPAAPAPGIPGRGPAWASALTLSFLALFLVGLGIFPQPAIQVVQVARLGAAPAETASRTRLAPPRPPRRIDAAWRAPGSEPRPAAAVETRLPPPANRSEEKPWPH